jgi:hypothetical protein
VLGSPGGEIAPKVTVVSAFELAKPPFGRSSRIKVGLIDGG